MNENFARRRKTVLERLADNAALVLAAAPEIIIGRDTELRYNVDPELYYLTGYTEPEAVLVLNPHAAEPFTLFVRARDPQRELWTGTRGGEDAARAVFGADRAHPIGELAVQLPKLLAGVDVVYARTNGRAELDAALQRGAVRLMDPGALLDDLRQRKDAGEIELMREAARISCEAFADALRHVRPGVGEWQIEAAVEYGFRSRGADGPAFPTIAAAGGNATVLHYISNRMQAQAGELLLLDAGARYRQYCADITRTVPVSGRFSQEQRDLYDVVLAAHDAAIAAARPGESADAPHQAARRILADGLLQLEVLNGSIESVLESDDGLKQYYPHRTSHWLGLDVHDVGAYAHANGPVLLEAGMALTIEPGLYLPGRKLGIRIEDDVLVTENGPEVLTAALPAGAAAVEALASGT